MFLALAEATNNLFSPDRFDLSQQTGGQQPPISAYVYAVCKTVCQPCVMQTFFAANSQEDGCKFFTPEKAVTRC